MSKSPFLRACLFCHDTLDASVDLRLLLLTLIISCLEQYFVVKYPGVTPESSKTLIMDLVPLLKFNMAEHTPSSKVNRSTYTPLGHFSQIIPFNASLLFCVVPCKHFHSRYLLLRSWKIGAILLRT